MRFISPYAKFKLRLIPEEAEQLASGQWRTVKKGFFAEFEPHAFTPRERDLAVETWGPIIRKGSRALDDALTMPAPQTWRIGTFDTEQAIHDPVKRAEVEELMLAHPRYGRKFLAVPEEVIPAPWPKYDDFVAGGRGRTNEAIAADIVETVKTLGLDPAGVIAYEQANRNRDEVVAALEALSAGEPEEDKIEVSV